MAKQFTSNMVFGKIVEVMSVDKDRYGRTIASVYVNGASLNKELLRAGLAWHYKHYSKDRDLAILEGEARANKIGLWSGPNPIPPWKWRRIRRR
jgi:micrococcal nuclease